MEVSRGANSLMFAGTSPVGFSIPLHRQLMDLCRWVLEEPGISSLRQIPPGGSVHSNAGISEWFAPTVISNAVQDVCHGEPVDDFYRDSVEQEYVI